MKGRTVVASCMENKNPTKKHFYASDRKGEKNGMKMSAFSTPVDLPASVPNGCSKLDAEKGTPGTPPLVPDLFRTGCSAQVTWGSFPRAPTFSCLGGTP